MSDCTATKHASIELSDGTNRTRYKRFKCRCELAVRIMSESRTRTRPPKPKPIYDWVVVYRRVNGDHSVVIHHKQEYVDIIRQLNAKGHSDKDIGRIAGLNHKRVQRIRKEHGIPPAPLSQEVITKAEADRVLAA